MALVLADRVRDTTTTTGTGTVTLSGTAPTGYQTFDVGVGNTNTTYYTINGGDQWEVGLGTYSSVGSTLTRDAVLSSSNGGALVNFDAGTKDVFVTYPAEESVYQDGAVIKAGTSVLPVANGGTGATTFTANRLLKGNGTGAVTVGGINDQSSSEAVYITSAGNVGIGTSSPSSALEVARGSGSAATISLRGNNNAQAAETVFGQSTAGGSFLFVRGNTELTIGTNNTERMRITNTGNVGIGTTSPTALLHVQGGSVRTSGSYIVSGAGELKTSLAGTGVAVNTSASISFETGGTPAERMRITSAGNVGIGTSSPFGVLQARAGANQNLLVRGPVALADGVSLYSVNDANTEVRSMEYTASLHAFLSGNVGVGVPNPAVRMEIVGASGFNPGTQNTYAMWVANSGSANGDLAFGSSTTAAHIQSWGVKPLVLNSVGNNVGIGTSSPSEKLVVVGTAQANNFLLNPSVGTVGYANNSANVVFFNETGAFGITNISVFHNGGSERMRITSAGNVGIGTSSPGAKLDVVGAALLREDSATGANPVILRNSNSGNNTGKSVTAIFQGVDTVGTVKNVGAITYAPTDADYVGSNLLFSVRAGDALPERMRITSAGSVGIGTSSPSFQLQLSTDSAAKPSSALWTVASDSRIKNETGEYTKGLDAVCALRPVTYTYNGAAGFAADGRENISIIAQEAMQHFPECVGTYSAKMYEEDEDETELYNWNGHALMFALVNAVKELKAQNDDFRARIAQLEGN